MFCPPGQARSNNIDKIRYCSQYIDGLFQVFSSQEQRTAQLCKRAKGYDLQLSASSTRVSAENQGFCKITLQ